MNKFIVLYMMPMANMDEWMKLPEETRKSDQAKMEAAWGEWMLKNGSKVKETGSAGKTKRVTSSGIQDTKNDVMMYSIVEAATQDEVATLFANHPHVTMMPGAYIDIMTSKDISELG